MVVNLVPRRITSLRDPHCGKCPLGSLTRSESDTCVMASDPSAEVMVVTRNPLSASMMKNFMDDWAGAGGNPDHLGFTSVNRCRVWDVDPTKTAQKTCATEYLLPELAMIQPKVIVALGNEALYVLTGRSGITKYRGQRFMLDDAVVFPTISPSAVKRNPGLAEGYAADLRFADGLRAGEAPTGTATAPMRMVTTKDGLKALQAALRAADGIAYDIESNGFDEYRDESAIVSLSITTWAAGATRPDEVWLIPLDHPQSAWRDRWRDVVRLVTPWMRRVRSRVAHNGKFDQRWLAQFGSDVPLTFDTMLAAHLLNENRPKGLKQLSQSLLGVEPWAISTADLQEQPIKRVLKYNGLDTWYTAYLYFLFREQLKEQPRLARIMARVMMPASNAFVQIERQGIWTDRERLNDRAIVARDTLERIDHKLLTHVPPADEWPEGIKEPNFNASNFARWLLFEHLGLPVLQRGKNKPDGSPGNPSMAEAVLQKLQVDHPHPVLDGMLERTQWQKYSSAFFSAYQDQIDSRDRIHTTFKLNGTVTGRLSSGKGDDDKVTGRVQNRGVNLQQVPRDQFVRGIFGAPPGWVFVECDYSQIELRVAGFMAQDKHMLHLYNTGQDIHMTMAMRMTNKPASEVTKEERKKAKAVNFGFLYGMGATKFIDTAWSNYGVVVSEAEALAFRRAFFNEFPDLPRWHRRSRSLAHKYKRVESPLGRVRHLPDIDSPNDGVRSEAERQAINSPVQSFASDMTVLALIQITRQLHKRGLRARSVGTVHDAVNFEVPISEVPVVVPMIRDVMENLPLERDFGVRLNVPIVADAAIGKYWGDKEELDGNLSQSPVALTRWLNEHPTWANDEKD